MVGVERRLQVLLDAFQWRRQRREHAAALVLPPEQRGVPAGGCGRFAQLRGRGQDGLVMLSCSKGNVAQLAEWLIKHGAETVTVGQVDYVFTAKNALWEKLAKRLG